MGYPNDAKQSALYDRIGTHNTFDIHPGVCVLPLAEDPPTDLTELAEWSPVVVLRLHAPYRLRQMTYLADKQNNPPAIPEFGDTGAFVFLGGSISVDNNLNGTGRNFDWVVSTSYNYVENCVIRPQDGLVLGTPPYPTVTGTINQQYYSNMPPTIGAVAYAGLDAVVGYSQGQVITTGSQGELRDVWGYNTASFFPGTLFYTDLPNSGKPVVAIG